MNILFEELVGAWCAPYDPDRFPAYLRGDPLKAYGQYAFEEGFKLALELAFSCLDPKDLSHLE